MATSNKYATELAERLKKATPEQLAEFSEALFKRAEHMAKISTGLQKAMDHCEKLGDHLDDMKDHMDTLHESVNGADKSITANLKKNVVDATAAIKALYDGMVTEQKGMEEAHTIISGAIEEYENEAETEAAAGIAAVERTGSDKAYRGLERAMAKQNKLIVKMQKAHQKEMQSLVAGISGAFSSAAAPPAASPASMPMRTAITVDKSADGTGQVIKIAGAAPGVPPAIMAGDVAPVLSDGVTPNPEFTKLAKSTGEACQAALRDLPAQQGNPFAGLPQELFGRIAG